jgi:UDP-2,3-diacylglucosamine pyrophosphatase LpxH
VLHARWAQRAFRAIHPDLGFALARRTSHTSRDYTSGRAYAHGDGMRDEAARRIAAGADVVIMGHRHIPCVEAVGSGLYVNLGEWLSARTYAVHTPDTGIRLFTRRDGAAEPWTTQA